MVVTNLSASCFLELTVMLFQVVGVVTLGLWRLVPVSRWAERARVAFVVAMIGLGITGACCGQQDSEFALFAGGTMTALLIGMTLGGGTSAPTLPDPARGAEPKLAG